LTLTADGYNSRELAARRIIPADVTRLTESWQRGAGLLVDGKLGPKTRESLRAGEASHGEPADQADFSDGGFDGPLSAIPTSRREVYDIFGNPGSGKVDKRWRKENIVTVRDLPGVPSKWHFQVHRLAEPYVREALRRAQVESDYRIERAACFVFRHIQHNPAKPLSLHSWGIAFDVDPSRNSAKRMSRGSGPAPWDDEWNDLWPDGLDEGFVRAVESVGFTWGGVWGRSGSDFADRATHASYFDPMHFELRLRG
jgi:hypothetical protein